MATAEIWNENTALIDPEIQELSDKVTQQVIGIIEMVSQEMVSQEVASQEEKTPKTFLAYSVPSPGVRYYF